MATVRTILHLDLDAFFCAVEERRDPSLSGRPFAVGGRPDGRGVVASCSYAARRLGVHSAMPMAAAVRLCPTLLIVRTDFAAYRAAAADVMARAQRITPVIERLSIDEAFLDTTAVPGDGEELAARLQATIRDELALPCSIGVAANRLVAKIATEVAKTRTKTDGYPNAVLAVPPGTEAHFLAPLPVSTLWGVGPKTADRLAALGIRTVGVLARWPEEDLGRRFGRHGATLARHARGIDDREVTAAPRVPRSVSTETTFPRDVADGEALRSTIRAQSSHVARDLRRSGLAASTVRIKLRWSDFTTITRQVTLSSPTDRDAAIRAAAESLLLASWPFGRPVRLIGVGVDGLREPARQLALPEGRPPLDPTREHAAREAVDRLRGRFGEDTIRWGRP